MTKISKANPRIAQADSERKLFISVILLFGLGTLFLAVYLVEAILVYSDYRPQTVATAANNKDQPAATASAQKFGAAPTFAETISQFFTLPATTPNIPLVSDAPIPPGGNPTAPTAPIAPSASLYLGSFGYTYDNVDQSQTTLYFDNIPKGILFPPLYDWIPAEPAVISAEQAYFSSFLKINNFNGPYADRRCRGEDCLVQEGNQLFYKGQALAVPAGLNAADIAAVSIGVLPSRWLVGYTLRDGAKYRGEVYYFNDQDFSRLALPAPVVSDYFGLWGFGGEDNDFLIIYGAYEGQAYRVRGNSLTELNKFFGIRVMSGGFKAEVIKVPVGKSVNWYISSATSNRPRLIKLWQNNGSEIAGETVFADLAQSGSLSASWKLREAKTSGVSLLARIVAVNGQSDWRVFSDRGFINNQAAILITNPITNDGSSSEIIIKKIALSQLDLDKTSQSLVKFLFSSDGQAWQNIPLGRDLDFSAGPLRSYLLKIVFPAAPDKFYSPYIGSVYFNYLSQRTGAALVVTPASNQANTPAGNIPANQPVQPTVEIPSGAVRLEVSAQGFSPKTFQIKSGERVTIALTAADDNTHVFVFPNASLMALTTMILGRETKLLTFTAPAVGSYQFRDDMPAYRVNQGEMIVE